MHTDGVHVQITETGLDGTTRFIDETLPYIATSGPFRKTAAMPATTLSFRWSPGSFNMDYHPSPRRRLVLVTEGALEIGLRSGERRVFKPGDIYSLRDTWGEGHRSRALDGKPFRSALISLDNEIVLDRREHLERPEPDGIAFLHNQETSDGVSFFEHKTMPFLYGGQEGKETGRKPFRSALISLDHEIVLDRREHLERPEPDGIEFLHNQETSDGVSFFEHKTMPFLYGGQEGKETGQIALRSFQFAKAPADLDYQWHPAPQRQAVLVLTGGLAMEYGDGSNTVVQPGGFLIGEDTDGRGHITRAVNGAERFSIFAHLA